MPVDVTWRVWDNQLDFGKGVIRKVLGNTTDLIVLYCPGHDDWDQGHNYVKATIEIWKIVDRLDESRFRVERVLTFGAPKYQPPRKNVL